MLGLATAGFAAYEIVEAPTNPVFGAAVTKGPPTQRVVALTFDDGPNPPYTTQILRVLEQEHVHATFFLVGRAAAAYPWVVRREVADGDAIGNHSWEHAHLIVLTPSQLRTSIQRTDRVLRRITGRHTSLMRPPFGARDWLVMQTMKKMGYTVVLWNVPLARDWEYPPPRVIVQRVLSRVSDGSIMVLHDGNEGRSCGKGKYAYPPHVCDRSQDVVATRVIVQTLKHEGYRFVTIPELIAMGKPVTHKRVRATR
ncbi:MAG TPA: polysaccharide deacetylase family protein [Candidatus Baltobacteraceae bacterium]|nr:polysaccharide deacetylase family protein [Candidatus Baltobacteraceae bacterium]